MNLNRGLCLVCLSASLGCLDSYQGEGNDAVPMGGADSQPADPPAPPTLNCAGSNSISANGITYTFDRELLPDECGYYGVAFNDDEFGVAEKGTNHGVDNSMWVAPKTPLQITSIEPRATSVVSINTGATIHYNGAEFTVKDGVPVTHIGDAQGYANNFGLGIDEAIPFYAPELNLSRSEQWPIAASPGRTILATAHNYKQTPETISSCVATSLPPPCGPGDSVITLQSHLIVHDESLSFPNNSARIYATAALFIIPRDKIPGDYDLRPGLADPTQSPISTTALRAFVDGAEPLAVYEPVDKERYLNLFSCPLVSSQISGWGGSRYFRPVCASDRFNRGPVTTNTVSYGQAFATNLYQMFAAAVLSPDPTFTKRERQIVVARFAQVLVDYFYGLKAAKAVGGAVGQKGGAGAGVSGFLYGLGGHNTGPEAIVLAGHVLDRDDLRDFFIENPDINLALYDQYRYRGGKPVFCFSWDTATETCLSSDAFGVPNVADLGDIGVNAYAFCCTSVVYALSGMLMANFGLESKIDHPAFWHAMQIYGDNRYLLQSWYPVYPAGRSNPGLPPDGYWPSMGLGKLYP